MTYDFNRLNSYDFEQLVQSICKKIIGPGCTAFGEGPDGGREASFHGVAPFPSFTDRWDGYWVIQAKYRTITTEPQSKDHKWLKREMDKELKNYLKRNEKVKHPDNLIFFTNIILTAVAGKGGQDLIAATCREYEKTYGIMHIHVISNHDLQNFLNSDISLAISFAPFILPGDVLWKMLELQDNDRDRHKIVHEAISRFLEIEFMEDVQSKLDQAGKLVTDKINLEKVFIDLDVQSERGRGKSYKFIVETVKLGNKILRWKIEKDINKFVLKAGPGQGKSTLSQFLAQSYRAFFLRDQEGQDAVSSEVLAFISDYQSLIPQVPKWPRLTFKVILKDYAGWITTTHEREYTESVSLQSYLAMLITKKTGIAVRSFELEILLRNMASFIVFDGLDEVPVSSNREEVIHELNIFSEMILRKMDADVIIVATTRPQGYSKEFDASKYNHLNIQDLSYNSCRLYLERLLDNTVDNLIERETKLNILVRALEDPKVSRIMKSPLQASIMAILVNAGGEPPTNKFDLFKQYFSTILNREKQRGISEILKSDTSSVVEIHYKLGVYLQAISEKSINPSATIEVTEFEKILRDYLTDKGFETDEVLKYTVDIQNAAIDRLVFIAQMEDQRIGFVIRSLQEYFAANGYIDNIADYLVKERIQKISTNAYWSNTLIFITGYIAEHKKYLVDFVISLCGELNGEEHDPGVKNASSVSKLGSWLALDILNEGIFRNNPGIENRFCKYLEPLFELPYIDKHLELPMLSESILQRWVIKFLKEAFTRDSVNKTCWNLVSDLSFNGQVDLKEMLTYLPESPAQRLECLMILAERGIYGDLLIECFNDDFLNFPMVDLFEIFDYDDHNDFIEAFLQNIKPENLARAWELILFTSIRHEQRGYEYLNLFEVLGLNLRGREWPQYHWADENLSHKLLEVVEGINLELSIFEPMRDTVVEKIIDFTRTIGGETSLTLVEYLEKYDFASYNVLIKALNCLESEYGSYLKGALSRFDSLNYFLSAQPKVTFELFDQAKNDILDICYENISLTPEQVIAAGRFALDTNSFNLNLFSSQLPVLANRYAGVENAELPRILRKVMGQNSLKLSEELLNSLSEDSGFMDFYRRNTMVSNNVQYYYSTYRVLDVMYLLEVTEIAEFIQLQHTPYNNFLEIVVFFDQRVLDVEIIKVSFNKCLKVIQLQFLTDQKVSYKYLFQMVIYYIDTFNQFLDAMLPFSDMYDDENIDEFGTILLLFDEQINEKKVSKIQQLLHGHNEHLYGNDFQRVLIFVLRNMPITSFTEIILVILNGLITQPCFLKTQLMQFTKQFAQNQPSLVEIKDYTVS